MARSGYGNFAEVFLTAGEKERFASWREAVMDRSITNGIVTPVFERVARVVPHHVAPNVLTLIGTAAVLQAWYVLQAVGPTTGASAASWLSILVYWCMHNIDGKHAIYTMNDTPIGELFKYICDSISTVFIPMLVCQLFGAGDNLELHWYVVQMTQLVLMLKHYSAFRRRTYIRYSRLFGPGEAMSIVLLVLAVRTVFGLHWIVTQYLTLYGFVRDYIVLLGFGHFVSENEDPLSRFGQTCRESYWVVFGWVLLYVWFYKPLPGTWEAEVAEFGASSPPPSPTGCAPPVSKDSNQAGKNTEPKKTGSKWRKQPPAGAIKIPDSPISSITLGRAQEAITDAVFHKQHLRTRRSLLLCLLARVVPFLLSLFHENITISLNDVVLDGLFIGVVTSDLVVGRMAGRELHYLVVGMCLAVVLPGMQFLLVVFVLLYYAMVLGDLCWFMNLPLLTSLRNVYCDGVYDLCHVGHKNLFRAALRHGNRLYVGVCGDADCADYKRPPVMTCKERCAEVEACKAVTKVIPDAPTFGISEEFIRKHRIHVVCCGEEYIERYPDPKDDPYYRVPRQLGIVRPLPRTEGLSTSALIRRVQAAAPAHVKNTPKEAVDEKKKKSG